MIFIKIHIYISKNVYYNKEHGKSHELKINQLGWQQQQDNINYQPTKPFCQLLK